MLPGSNQPFSRRVNIEVSRTGTSNRLAFHEFEFPGCRVERKHGNGIVSPVRGVNETTAGMNTDLGSRILMFIFKPIRKRFNLLNRVKGTACRIILENADRESQFVQQQTRNCPTGEISYALDRNRVERQLLIST